MNDDDFYPCPCCGNKMISEPGNYEICPVCDWEDDPVQLSDPDLLGGENILSLLNATKVVFIKN